MYSNVASEEEVLRASLAVLVPQVKGSEATIARLKRELTVEESLLTRRTAAISSLLALLGDEASGGPGSMQWRSASTFGAAVGSDAAAAAEATAAAKMMANEDNTEPTGKRVRSTELVVEVVRDAYPYDISRDEVIDEMKGRGHTAQMKDPRNAINTALYRAVQRGWIEADGDRYRSSTPPEASGDLRREPLGNDDVEVLQ